jgi:hypothetical protein
MARFDPNSHPDRFVFEAQARQIRAEEIDKASTPSGCGWSTTNTPWSNA